MDGLAGMLCFFSRHQKAILHVLIIFIGVFSGIARTLSYVLAPAESQLLPSSERKDCARLRTTNWGFFQMIPV